MNSLKQFLKDNLDGKYAYVSSGGLSVEGTMEERVKLVSDGSGLKCMANLEFNHVKLIEIIHAQLYAKREEIAFSYDDVNKIKELLFPIIIKTEVQIGHISVYQVKSFSTSLNDKYEIHTMEIIYKDGSICKIRAIENTC